MNLKNSYYSPANETEGIEHAAHEHTIDAPEDASLANEEENTDAEKLSGTSTEASYDTDNQQDRQKDYSSILGAGGLAGGLSGDGERTDEYDAAVMGLDD